MSKDLQSFWAWMVCKNYASYSFCDYVIYDREADLAYPTKQMLVGYMYEYINELLIKVINMPRLISCNDIDKVWESKDQYKGLAEIIKKLEKLLV